MSDTHTVRIEILLRDGKCLTCDVLEDDAFISHFVEQFGAGNDSAVIGIPDGKSEMTTFIRMRDISMWSVDRLVDIRPKVECADDSQCIEIKNFLHNDTVQELLNFCQKNIDNFQQSTISPAEGGPDVIDPRQRKSKVIYNISPFDILFKDLVKKKIIDISRLLCLNVDGCGNWDIQLTMHHDGAFFGRHQDAGTISNSDRALTFVYYFFHAPRAFQGGDLILYYRDNGREWHRVISPRNNTIVFFPSSLTHEVTPIVQKNGDPMSARFTVNGWIAQAPTPQ